MIDHCGARGRAASRALFFRVWSVLGQCWCAFAYCLRSGSVGVIWLLGEWGRSDQSFAKDVYTTSHSQAARGGDYPSSVGTGGCYRAASFYSLNAITLDCHLRMVHRLARAAVSFLHLLPRDETRDIRVGALARCDSAAVWQWRLCGGVCDWAL